MLPVRAQRTLIAAALLTTAFPAAAADFTVTGSNTTAQTLDPADGETQTGTVESAGVLDVSVKKTPAITVSSSDGTGVAVIVNSGQIIQDKSDRAIRANSGAVTLTITNNADALIEATGEDAIQVSSGADGTTFSLTNAGTITSGGGRAVNVRDAGGSNSIVNEADGVLSSTADDAVRPGAGGTIDNYGTIQATPTLDDDGESATGYDGIQADESGTAIATGVTVTNESTGVISGRHGITGSASGPDDDDPDEAFTITVINQAGGTITGVNGSGINIDNNTDDSDTSNVLIIMGDAVVTNDGTITGNYDSTYSVGDGDGVDVDGLLTLVNNGIIRGTGAAGDGDDGNANNPEGVSIGGGSITNNAGAEITGQNTNTSSTAKGHGVLVDDSSGGDAFAATTITNAGTIRGYDSYAIKLVGDWDDTITNESTGVIEGAGDSDEGAALQTGDGADTVTNSGSIIADANDLAIDLGDGDDSLTLGSGASVQGGIDGGDGSNTLTLDPGAGVTFSDSSAVSNFSTIVLQSGSASFGSLTLGDGLTLEIATPGSDTLTVTGAASLDSGEITVDIDATDVDPGTYTLATFGSVSGITASNVALGTAPAHATLTLDGTSLVLTVKKSGGGGALPLAELMSLLAMTALRRVRRRRA
ncbi:MAG: hypothetical protein QM661_15585 [Solimonas sp.]